VTPAHADVLTPDGQGENEVSTGLQELGDIDTDCLQVLLEDISSGHTIFLEDQASNEEVMGSIVDFSSGRKFDEVDPIEAAAAEVILKKKV
jgi:hypothetical protein